MLGEGIKRFIAARALRLVHCGSRIGVKVPQFTVPIILEETSATCLCSRLLKYLHIPIWNAPRYLPIPASKWPPILSNLCNCSGMFTYLACSCGMSMHQNRLKQTQPPALILICVRSLIHHELFGTYLNIHGPSY